MENNKIKKFNLQLFAEDGQEGAKGSDVDYKAEYEKMVAERDSYKAEAEKQKSIKDQYATENKKYKDKEKEQMSEEQKRQQEYQDLVEAKNKIETELQAIKLEKELLGEGFTSEESAELIKSNFSVKVLGKIVKAKIEEAVKSAEAELIKKTTPDSLVGDGTAKKDSGKTGFQKYQESKTQPKDKVEI